MLNRLIFNKGIDKLVTEFESKGFKMTKERAMQWYEFMKDMSEEQFNKKIEWVLKNCRYVPSMADVIKANSENEIPFSNLGNYDDYIDSYEP